MDPIVFGQLNEAYHRGVYSQENLSEEEHLDIQEWVEALIDEGYDLDQYSDDELYEAYLFDLKEAKVDSNLTPLQKIRKRNQDPSLVMPVGQQTAERRDYHKGGRGVKKEKGEKSAFGTMRHIGGPYKEELDLYDLVSEYLVSEGFCDSYEDADVIMANMSEEWREGIVEEVLDEAVKGSQRSIGNRITGNDIRQVRRGGSTIYKKPKWQDRVETRVSRDMGKEGHKNPYQYGSGATKQAKASVERMNAEKNVEVKHDYDGNDDVETVSTNSLSGYRTVPTNYRARRRRASGR
jgi:hypothetical protein